MNRSRIGINIHDLRIPAREGLAQAARMDFRTVELPALEGETAPENLSSSGRRHLSRLARDYGLALAALDADFGARALADPARVDAAVHRTSQVLVLARELGIPLVVGGVGRIEESADRDTRQQVIEALRVIGEQADRIGPCYAITTSYASPQTLRSVLDEVACPSIRVCLDPGALVMAGHEPIAATELLADQILLSHARDGLAGTAERLGRETPLGSGYVNLAAYLATLAEAGYAGPQILRRTDSDRPAEDLAAAQKLLEAQLR
jgi:L-ribulose-5-phosphate 3-epimerase